MTPSAATLADLELELEAAASMIRDPVQRAEWVRRILEGDLDGLTHDYLRYRWRPVDVVTFLHDPYYLNFPYDEVYPKIREALVEATTGDYDEVVPTGGIGWGKSFFADLLVCYNVYLVSCLRDPQRVYGLAANSPIVFVQQSLTEDLARKVLYEHVSAILRRSPYFLQAFPFDRRIKNELVFPANVRVQPISGKASISQNVIGGIIDETNFMAVIAKSLRAAGGGVFDQAEVNYNAIRKRQKSRFLQRGRLPGQLILPTSKRYDDDFTERKIAEARREKAETGKTSILVVDYPTWETHPASRYSGKTFRVFAGSGTRSSKILTDDEVVPIDLATEHVVNVPIEFRPEFERDLDGALRDIAGRSTRAIRPFIVRAEAVGNLIEEGRRHPFNLDVTNLRDGLEILTSALDLDVDAARAVHLDLSKNDDRSGFCMGYVAGLERVERTKIQVEQASPDADIRLEERADGRKVYVELLPVIVYEAMLRIERPPGDEVQLEDVMELVIRLRDEVGIPIVYVTADTYRSAQALQMLRRRGFKTEELSVDITMRPYEDLKAVLYDGRGRTYDYRWAMSELLTLEIHEGRGGKVKVDHPPHAIDPRTGQRVKGSKDVADAMAGVTYTLVRRRETWARGTSGRPNPQRPSRRRRA